MNTVFTRECKVDLCVANEHLLVVGALVVVVSLKSEL